MECDEAAYARKLGCGTNACAFQTFDGVVAKVFTGSRAVADAEAEAEGLQAITGLPDTPQFIKMLTCSPRRAVVYETLMEGVDVRETWTQLPENFEEQVELLVQALHERGIAHADLHDENLKVQASGRIGLIDLGNSILHATAADLAADWVQLYIALLFASAYYGGPDLPRLRIRAREAWSQVTAEARRRNGAMLRRAYEHDKANITRWWQAKLPSKNVMKKMWDVVAPVMDED